MGTKISELPPRVTLLNEDLLVIANDAEDMNYKISLGDLKAQIGGLEVADLTTLIDVAGTTTYVGKALIGSLTSQAVWKIMRIVELDGDLEIKWAGSALFTQVWDNRSSLGYS